MSSKTNGEGQFKFTGFNEWIDYMNKSYIDLYGPKIKVFKLDKVATQIDDLYMEEKRTGRIYLPPFEIRSLHDDNKWVGFLSTRGLEEQEQNMTIFVNFNNMVQKIHELKTAHVCNMAIKYKGNSGRPSAQKIDNIFTIWVGDGKYFELDLNDPKYSTISRLTGFINSYDDWEINLQGKNDLSKNLINFARTDFSNTELMIYSEDMTYKNITDVIEIGDGILTNKWRLYEVMNIYPAGDFGWNYTTWKIDCRLAEPEKMNLPGNYIELLRQKEYGLRERYSMDGQIKKLN